MKLARVLAFAPWAALLLAFLVPASAQETEPTTGLGNAVCPDAELLGPKLITDICWSCLFPLLVMLDLFFPDRCNPDHFADFDVLYLSELDPTWNTDELAFFTNPEAAFVANPVAQAACLVDAA